MKKTLCVLALMWMVWTGFIDAVSAVEISGDITEDAVWDPDISPVILRSDVEISAGVTLTIRAGTEVQFGNTPSSSVGYFLRVNGTLRAGEATGAPVVFTGEDTDRRWNYIEFADSSVDWNESAQTGCIIQNATIAYGGNGNDSTVGNAAIKIISSSPKITNCVVKYSQEEGIIVSGGSPVLTGNRIHDTRAGIVIRGAQGATVTDNYLVSNTRGIQLDTTSEAVTINNNTISHTSTEGFGAALSLGLRYHNRLNAYRWEQTAGTTVSLSDAAVTKPTFTAPTVASDETLTFRLTVTDAQGMVGVDEVDVSVTGENQPPVAAAGSDQTVDEGVQVILDGGGSSDPDGRIASYAWVQSGGPTTLTLTNSTQTGQSVFVAPAVSADTVYTFQLTVDDNASPALSSSDSMVVTIRDTDTPGLPVAVAGPSDGSAYSFNEGTGTQTLAGSQSTGDLSVTSWFWEQTAGPQPLTIADSAVQNAVISVPAGVGIDGESYTFQLTVRDSLGRSDSDTVVVNINDTTASANLSPNAVVTDLPASVDENVAVTLVGGDSDDGESPSASVSSYNWVQIAGPSVNSFNNPTAASPTFTAPNVTENEVVTFELTVTDAGGLRDTAHVSTTINFVNEAPVASGGADQTVDEGTIVSLNGSGSTDSEDNIASWLWEQVGGTAVTLFNNTGERAYFKAPAITADETLVFRLTVTDGGPPVRSDQVLAYVTVSDVNTNPVAVAQVDMSGTLKSSGAKEYGSSVTLNSTNSSDSDGTIASHLWEQTGGTHVVLSLATTSTPTFTAPAAPGGSNPPAFTTLTFRVTVTDNAGGTDTDSVVVNLFSATSPVNQAPTAVAGPDQSGIAEAATVTLDGSDSYDPDMRPTITVTDNDFRVNDSEKLANLVAITAVEDANSVLTFSNNNLVRTSGKFGLLLFNWGEPNPPALPLGNNWWGTASETEVQALIYDRTEDNLLPVVTYAPFKTAEIEGIGSSKMYPPVVNAGEAQRTANPDEVVALDGSATHDPENRFTYLWSQVSGKTVTITNATSKSASFVVPSLETGDIVSENTLRFSLKATDAGGFSDTREIQVTIEARSEAQDTHQTSGCFLESVAL